MLLCSPAKGRKLSKVEPRHEAPRLTDNRCARTSSRIKQAPPTSWLVLFYCDQDNPIASNLSGVPRTRHPVGTRRKQVPQSTIGDQARPILGDCSRFLSRASLRAPNLTQLYTPRLRVLGGVSGFRLLDGLERSSLFFVPRLWDNFK